MRAGGTRLSQLALGLPLGTGPPSTTLPWELQEPHCLSVSPSPHFLLKSISRQFINLQRFSYFALDGEALQVKKNKTCVFVLHIQKDGFVCLPVYLCVTVCFEQRAPAAIHHLFISPTYA